MSKPPLPFPRGTRIRGRATFFIVAFATVAVVVAVFVWVVARAGKPHDVVHVVSYGISGSATKATVIYTRPDGQRDGTVDLPWSTTFDTGSGMTLSLVAHATDGGSITCVVSEDGKDVATHEGRDCSLLEGS